MAHAGGRPPKIKGIQDLDNKVKEYLIECERDKKIPYLTGFYVFLGVWHGYFCDLLQAKPEYSKSIKKMWNQFAYSYEENMGAKKLTPAHAIFMLKNCGYVDRVEVNANITDNQSLSDLAKMAKNIKAKQAK